MNGANPYAAPVAEAQLPEAPPSFGWKFDAERRRLLVRNQAVLPTIDPFNGRSEDVMHQQLLRVRYAPYWPWVFIAGGAGAGGLIGLVSENGMASLAPGLGIGLLTWILSGLFFSSCTIRVFFCRKTLRRHRIVNWIVNGLLLAWVLGSFTPLRDEPGVIQWLFVAWVLGVILTSFFLRRMTCRTKRDSWFEIRGLHPKAIEFLASERGLQPVPEAAPVAD